MTFSSSFSFAYSHTWTAGDARRGTFHLAKRAALERTPIGSIVSPWTGPSEFRPFWSSLSTTRAEPGAGFVAGVANAGHCCEEQSPSLVFTDRNGRLATESGIRLPLPLSYAELTAGNQTIMTRRRSP